MNAVIQIALFVIILTLIALVRLKMAGGGRRGGGCGCGSHGGHCKEATRAEPGGSG